MDSKDSSAQATFLKAQSAQSSATQQLVLLPATSTQGLKVHIHRLGLQQTKMDSLLATVDSWTSQLALTSSLLMSSLEQSCFSLQRLSAWSNLDEREQRDHKRVVEKKKGWLGNCGSSQPLLLGDVVNQQTHFTCNEDTTRAALVISTI